MPSWVLLVGVCGTLLACDTTNEPSDAEDMVVQAVLHQPPPWPEWVLGHWVWEDESTRQSAEELVDGYLANRIPVGAIIIDSPWETAYNTFEFDLDRYPDAPGMISRFHSKDVRVVCWITSVMNIEAPEYEQGLNSGYFINAGQTFRWWKGVGSYLDYGDPGAVTWWHGLMDRALDLRIDGWKTDMSARFLQPWDTLDSYAGPLFWKDYQAAYYRDFFNYTRERLGDDRIILARPVDMEWGGAFAPRDVNFAGWVGDQFPNWEGLGNALTNLRLSASAGYVNIGSDIGGYWGGGIRDKELFIRWAQLGALSPIMENGGQGEHRPWAYDAEVLAIYRQYAELHEALIPYLYSRGAESHAGGLALMRFIPEGASQYLLGDDILVAPVDEPARSKAVEFPRGTWYHLIDGTVYEGGRTWVVSIPLNRYPIFAREGAIIPMALEASVFDNNIDHRPLTVAVYPKAGARSVFDLYEEGGTGARIEVSNGPSTTILVSGTDRAIAFRLVGWGSPRSVVVVPHGSLWRTESIEALAGLHSGYTYLGDHRELWIKPGSAERGLLISVQFVDQETLSR